MCRCVVSVCLGIIGMHRAQSDHARLNLLSRETLGKKQRWSKGVFDFQSISPTIPNFWLLLVVSH